jgi:hypothetical protein
MINLKEGDLIRNTSREHPRSRIIDLGLILETIKDSESERIYKIYWIGSQLYNTYHLNAFSAPHTIICNKKERK